MSTEKVITQIKFSKLQMLPLLLFPIGLAEPVRRAIIQGIEFHQYYWFLLCFVVFLFIFLNFIWVPAMVLAGIPALTLTNRGIRIAHRGYYIEWNDIEAINLVESSGRSTSYIMTISVKDDWKYIGALRNPFLRYFRWYMKDYNAYNTPFSIRLSMLEGDNADIYAAVENCFHNHKNHGLCDGTIKTE
jgi:hypothetical protein